MKTTLVARLDKKGSEAAECFHYIFGKPGSNVSGGVYINKKMEYPPDFIEIEIKRGDDNA